MKLRLGVVALSIVVVAALVSGCSDHRDAVAPTPSFASEAEAFAAAEQTYRNYVDALNQVDLSDPATFEEVYRWTTGELNASDRTNFTTWHAEGVQIHGASTVTSVFPSAVENLESQTIRVELDACYDVSGVEVFDAAGASMVSPDRPTIQTLHVELVGNRVVPTRLAVTSISPAPEGFTC